LWVYTCTTLPSASYNITVVIKKGRTQYTDTANGRHAFSWPKRGGKSPYVRIAGFPIAPSSRNWFIISRLVVINTLVIKTIDDNQNNNDITCKEVNWKILVFVRQGGLTQTLTD
jgi:hypothetical protein